MSNDENEVDYGKLNKRVVFTENEHRHAKLVLKLKHDGFKQSQFFRAVITAYINDDPLFQQFVDEVKDQSPRLKRKSRRFRDTHNLRSILSEARLGVSHKGVQYVGRL